MFKLVVLSALVAIVAAAPSGHLAYSAVVAAPAVYAAPAAVSHQYRTDVISKPVIQTYAAPAIVEQAVVAAPAAYVAAPTAYVAAPVSSAITHQSRVDYQSAPVLSYAAHVPAVHAVHAAPLAVQAW